MPFVGLVRSSEWEPPPPGDDEPRPRRDIPWRAIAWLAAFFAVLLVAPALGGLAGYVVILVAVAVGLHRVDRACSRQYWRGLRDHQA
jgi:hypothetical protein